MKSQYYRELEKGLTTLIENKIKKPATLLHYDFNCETGEKVAFYGVGNEYVVAWVNEYSQIDYYIKLKDREKAFDLFLSWLQEI